ncbi:MAG: hypothetical protein ACREV9_15355, partial [Burkholderiales bacterium]
SRSPIMVSSAEDAYRTIPSIRLARLLGMSGRPTRDDPSIRWFNELLGTSEKTIENEREN